VRAFLGTDLKQLGYSATFKRHATGVWFPHSFGTEFQLRLFWGYARTITLSMETFDFQKTSTDSNIKFEEPEEPLELLLDRSPDLL
jgi:hypothetical protein